MPVIILSKMSEADRKKLGKAGMTASEASAAFAAKNERELQRQIASELLRRSIWFTQSATNKRTTNRVGTPDFLACIKGRFIAIEVKFGAGRLREEQASALADIERNGGAASVVRSFQDFRAFLLSHL